MALNCIGNHTGQALIATILTSTTLKVKGTLTCRLLYSNRVAEILCKIRRNTIDLWSKRPFSAVLWLGMQPVATAAATGGSSSSPPVAFEQVKDFLQLLPRFLCHVRQAFVNYCEISENKL